MSLPGEWFRRVLYLVRRRAMDDDLRREMEAHRALMDDPAAFGNALQLREEARDAWGWRWLDELSQDVRFAARTLGRTPGFTLTAIVTLALGIGVNTGMFGFVNGLLLRPLYDQPERVVGVYGRNTGAEGGMRGISYPNFLDIRDATASVFAKVAADMTGFNGLDAGEGARRTLVSRVTDGYFEVLGHRLARGRTFTTEETRAGAAPVAIISHSLWERRGATPDIVGQTIRVNGDPFTVIGVAGKGFTGTGIPGPEAWLPLALGPRHPLNARTAHVLDVVGRLRDGVSLEAATPALGGVAQRLAEAFPTINGGYTLQVAEPSRLLFMPGVRGGTFTALLSVMLMAMPAIVLLVACLNLADLLLARGHVRRQELAVRASLGGSRGRLIRQLLTEGVLLSLVGGVVGLWLSTWATGAMLRALQPLLPATVALPEVVVDWRVLAGTMAICVMASLVFGVWPAWALTGPAVVADLKRQGGESVRQPGGIRVGNALVVVQVAFSLVLLASAGLFLKSAIAATTVDPGFRLEDGILAEVDPSLVGYDDEEARAFHLALVDRVRALPGIDAVTIGSGFPFGGFNDSREVVPAGRTNRVDAVFATVGRDYARTLGLPMLAGRDFTDLELRSSEGERVAIVDDALAQRLWPDGGAVGQLVQFMDDEDATAAGPALRVVGVMPAVKHSLGTPTPFPHVYVPLGQHDDITGMTLHVRLAAAQDERAMLTTLARFVREADAQVPILALRTWRGQIDAGIEVLIFRAAARVCAIFGAIALLLAVIGVYGVKSYLVSRRTREFGIRIAAGADPQALLWQVLREGSRITGAGIVIGLVLAVGVGQLLRGMLYGVNAVEPIVLAIAPLILLGASLLASLVPARRAMRVDPTIALRSE